MDEGIIAKRYARAIFAIALKEGTVEAYRGGIAALAEALMTDADSKRYWDDPLLSGAERHNSLEQICAQTGIDGNLKSYLHLLVDRRRFVLLREIAGELGVMTDEYLRQSEALVVSAFEIDAEQVAAVRAALEKKTGKKINVTTQRDPSLIGGIVVRIGDEVYDGSIKGRLERMEVDMAGL